jgi:hypothetical protein
MRTLVFATLLALAVGLGGCDKPSADECQKAVDNITKIYGNDPNRDRGAAVRSCRAKSSRAQVACMASAKTAEDLAKCDETKK